MVFKQIGVREEFAAKILKLPPGCGRDKGASLHLGIAELCLSQAMVAAGDSWANTAHTHQAALELLVFSQQQQLKAEDGLSSVMQR